MACLYGVVTVVTVVTLMTVVIVMTVMTVVTGFVISGFGTWDLKALGFWDLGFRDLRIRYSGLRGLIFEIWFLDLGSWDLSIFYLGI